MARPGTPPSWRPSRATRIGTVLLAARLVHPVPSIIVAAVVAALAMTSASDVATTALLAIAMLSFQFSIGAMNDIADAEADAAEGVAKPIPEGVVSTRTAAVVAITGAAVGFAISAGFGVLVLLLGAAGWGCGAAYDLILRRAGLGWLCLTAALPLLLLWTWLAAGSSLPSAWPLVLTVAALAGPTLHLANSLVDLERDARAGRRTLAARLGPRGARRWLSVLVISLLTLAVTAMGMGDQLGGIHAAAAMAGVALSLAGVGLAWRESPRSREAGWLFLAVGLACLAIAWLSG